MTLAIIAIVAAVVLVGAIAVLRTRRASDGVDSFRRQIDALSPEARRTVVDQVQRSAERDPDEPDGDRGP